MSINLPKNGVKGQTKELVKCSSLGPIANLEEHVSPDWWNKIFNANYLKTDGDVVDDLEITATEVSFFSEALQLQPTERILDLCCGQGRHSLELARRQFTEIDGMDRSHYLIQRAKSTAKKECLKVHFREGDARKLPYATDTFDVVMILGNSFGYFETLQDDLAVLKEVFRVLKPWGRLLIEVADGDYLRQNFMPRSWEWIDKGNLVCRERSLSLDKQRLISREIISNVEKGVLADQFYAERLYSQENISELLAEANFKKMVFHGELTSNSKRNQDLGMMARRIVVTGTVIKDWSPVKIKSKDTLKNVVVVMGDPKKNDIIKPNAVFDEDDYYTIDQLKNALRQLPEYKITYLNNHDSLIQELANNKGQIDFVFNLCDEGFFNDPRQELHIPALLEMLKINYSGANPQCLAFCYDKSLVRGIAQEMGIPVPRAHFINPEDTVFEIPITFPVIVKPNSGDSSFGITQKSVCHNVADLTEVINEIRDRFGYDKAILIEEFLSGSDLTVGIIGNPPESYTVLPIAEEDYSLLPADLPRICGYEAKWDPTSIYWKNLRTIPANLDPETEKIIIECCLKLFERLECRDYSRFDWRLNAQGAPFLLEVNPNPGWCWDGHLAKMAKIKNISYSEMLEKILASTASRSIK